MKLWVTAAVFPPVLWVVVLTMPTVDGHWENHPAHFWLVLTAALASVGLGSARFALAVAFAFGLLAEAMVVIVWARNWQISWWEWHVLMLAAFIVIAAIARSEWHEERFSAIYLDRTLSGARDVSVLLADLSGFFAFSEQREPGEVAAMLRRHA